MSAADRPVLTVDEAVAAFVHANEVLAGLVYREATVEMERAELHAEVVADLLGTVTVQTGRRHTAESAEYQALYETRALRREAAEVARDLVLARGAHTVARLRMHEALGFGGRTALAHE